MRFSSPWPKKIRPFSVILVEPLGRLVEKARDRCCKEVRFWSPVFKYSSPASVISGQLSKLKRICRSYQYTLSSKEKDALMRWVPGSPSPNDRSQYLLFLDIFSDKEYAKVRLSYCPKLKEISCNEGSFWRACLRGPSPSPVICLQLFNLILDVKIETTRKSSDESFVNEKVFGCFDSGRLAPHLRFLDNYLMRISEINLLTC